MDTLFVYGTLMRGQEREGLVAHLPVRPASTRGTLWRAPAGYPALAPSASGATIAGEVLTLSEPRMFTVLDLYEGVGEGLYSRERITIRTQEGETPAWAYVMNAQQLRLAGCIRLQTTDWRMLRRRV